jgi:hypothetical protein
MIHRKLIFIMFASNKDTFKCTACNQNPESAIIKKEGLFCNVDCYGKHIKIIAKKAEESLKHVTFGETTVYRIPPTSTSSTLSSAPVDTAPITEWTCNCCKNSWIMYEPIVVVTADKTMNFCHEKCQKTFEMFQKLNVLNYSGMTIVFPVINAPNIRKLRPAYAKTK